MFSDCLRLPADRNKIAIFQFLFAVSDYRAVFVFAVRLLLLVDNVLSANK